ncbi:MAG: hypothetical protein IT287_09660, partial [Bdellovibrionaceae bacterium]|nr:hypothetical protein [Pseudobdellovibrionaceae bacterium]
MNDSSMKHKLLVLTLGLNFVSFLFCAYMLSQAKGSLNSFIFWGALVGLVIWGVVSVLFVTKMSKTFSALVIE